MNAPLTAAEEALRESGIGAPRVRRFATVEAARAIERAIIP